MGPNDANTYDLDPTDASFKTAIVLSCIVPKMHQALTSNLPLTQFINFRLILPCIIYRIKTIVLPFMGTAYVVLGLMSITFGRRTSIPSKSPHHSRSKTYRSQLTIMS